MKTRLLSMFALTVLLSAFTQIYSQDYYPLNDGDFWEYFETGENEIGNTNPYPYSVSREIMGDTLMDNGITYKIIKWDNMANYYPAHPVYKYPFYEFQRKDSSGNIYIYYNSEDHLFLDFSKKEGDIYPSHIPGWKWVVDEDPDDGAGNVWPGIGFRLMDSNQTRMRQIYCTPNMGPVCYCSDLIYLDIDGQLFLYTARQFNYWGSIIRGVENGYLLAKKQKINWGEFYPLHVGDLWVYNISYYKPGHGIEYYQKAVNVTNDTVMQDGNSYYNRDGKHERLDSLGNLYIWNMNKNKSEQIFHFSSVLGNIYKLKDSILIDYKAYNANYGGYDLFASVYNWGLYVYAENLGLRYFQRGDGHHEKLAGAYINGVLVYGDTTIYRDKPDTSNISLEDEVEIVTNYTLDQNYPNPFNPATNITFQLPKESFVSLIVYNVLGEEVETLLNEYRAVGKHTVTFDAHNLPSGIYFYTLQTNGQTETKKMLLIK